jgi:hypothetical protein
MNIQAVDAHAVSMPRANFRRVLLAYLMMLFAPPLLAAEPAKPEAPAADGNACAWFNSIDDWHELDDRNLIVWVSKTEFYHLELSAPLIDLGTAESIAFVDHNHDGRVCGFGMDEIVLPRSSIFGSSTIINMTRLDEAGLMQLADQYHIKIKMPKPKQNAAAEKEAAPK